MLFRYAFFAIGIIMPIGILFLESCMMKQGVYSLDNFTLHYWIGDGIPNIMEGLPGIFKNSDFKLALTNSLKLTFVNGIFGTLFGQMLGYICDEGLPRSCLDVLSLADNLLSSQRQTRSPPCTHCWPSKGGSQL